MSNLSKLKGIELKEMLNEVEKFPFLYRELLNFKTDISNNIDKINEIGKTLVMQNSDCFSCNVKIKKI